MRIKNRSWSPRVITLQGGKSLTLPGRGIGEISDEDYQGAELQRLAKSGDIAVLPGGEKKTADKGGEPGRAGEGGAASPPAAGSPPSEGESAEPQ
ncbi:MAG TPA: hypothetical protein VGX48_08200 [Pyrinomonadaceae bacterium]|nr:hypothetical protein [Pyrinomonadaceae bacterium]